MSQHNYTFKGEEVQIERWAWGVVYQDGSQLRQFGEDGVFHQIGEVDQDKVKMFTMFKPEDESKRIDLVMQPGMKIIHLYRNIKPWYRHDKPFIKVYLFGYKLKNKYHYNFILPDDRVIQSPVDNIDLVQFELDRK